VINDARSYAAMGMWDHFRGAFGKEEEDQEAMWVEATSFVRSEGKKDSAAETTLNVDIEKSTSPVTSSSADLLSSRPTSLLRPTPQEKVRLKFIRIVDGESEISNVDAFTGETVMDVAKREGLEPIEGVCGGHLGELYESRANVTYPVCKLI
jgi:hypothetical protein